MWFWSLAKVYSVIWQKKIGKKLLLDTPASPCYFTLLGRYYSVIWCTHEEDLLDNFKVGGSCKILSKNSNNGTRGIDLCKKNWKTPGTTQVPGVFLSANRRPVFGRMTYDFFDTHIYWLKMKILTWNFQDMILGVYQVHLWHQGWPCPPSLLSGTINVV